MHKSGMRTYLHCAVCAIAIAPIFSGLRANAQASSTELSFEVASVKPVLMDTTHPFNPRHFWAHVNAAGASYWSMTVTALIAYAYGVEQFQVTGPEWTAADRFDIDARFPEGADKKDEKKMLQALLKDRFKLAVRVEKRELEINTLVVGPHGAKLSPSAPDPVMPEVQAALKPGDTNAGEGAAKAKITTTPDGASKIDQGKRGTFSVKFDQETWSNHLEMSKMTMEELAGRLGSCLESGVRKVIDQTGMKGNYQVAYDCPVPGGRPASGGDAAGVPSVPQGNYVLTRSLDALGLKLEKRKVPMDVYVIYRVDKPSEN